MGSRGLNRSIGLFDKQVETRINIRTILQKSPEAAKHMVTEARKVLESWHATYMDVRHRIEESGTDHRWEFDRKRLFEQTNYMARVCGDLLEVSVQLLSMSYPVRKRVPHPAAVGCPLAFNVRHGDLTDVVTNVLSHDIPWIMLQSACSYR